MTDRTKLAEEIGSGRPRGCPSHPRHGRPCCGPGHILRGPARPCRCPGLHCAVLAAPAAVQDNSTLPSAAPSEPREPCRGRAKTTCLNSRRLNGLYSSLYLPTSKYHTCVCDQLLQIYPYSTTRALLLYIGPYMHPLNSRKKVTLLLFCN
jgi:hypothetical protein